MRRVEVFYDFAAPLCFVAHERVRRLRRTLPLDFAWVPWERWPDTPQPGAPADAAWRTLDPVAERLFVEQNLPFKASQLKPNTNLPLRAALWCEARGGGEDFRDRVFRRQYERGLDINHPDVLAGLVESTGLDPIAFLDDMKEGAYAKELRAHAARAAQLGVREVPTFLLGAEVVAGDLPWAAWHARLSDYAPASRAQSQENPRG